MSEEETKSATDKQKSFIGRLQTILRCAAPAGVTRSKELSEAWIPLAIGALTQDELQSLKLKPKLPRELQECGKILVVSFGVDPPVDYSAGTLRAWLDALGRHVPVPPQDKLLQYWQRALTYRDLNALAKENVPHIAGTLDPEKLSRELPRPVASFKPGNRAKEGQAVALLLAFAEPRGSKDPSALLAIPLACNVAAREFYPAPDGVAPFFNREWLEPPDPDDVKDEYFGTVDDCDAFTASNPPPQDADWPTYWQYVNAFVAAVTEEESTLPVLAPIIGKRDTHWKIVAWETNGAGAAVNKVYDRAIAGDLSSLLRLFSSKAPAAEVLDSVQAVRQAGSLLGHMDTYDRTRPGRAGFGLERSQRTAAIAATRLGDGQVQAVNGPPGTGKTSFLRAVIGTLWVEAAAKNAGPPIILAVGATNKAVTNVIESFAEIPGPSLEAQWESRWLPHLPSYGWFFPAAYKEDGEYPGFMLLRTGDRDKGEPPYKMTAAATEFARAAATRRSWLRDAYLDLHRQCLGLATPARDADQAAAMIQTRLRASIAEMHAIQGGFGSWVDASRKSDAFSRRLSDWQASLSSIQIAQNELRALAAQCRERIRILDDARSAVVDANVIENRRRRWWYRIWCHFFSDELIGRVESARSRAQSLLLSFDATLSWSANSSVEAIDRHITSMQGLLREHEKSLNLKRSEADIVGARVAEWERWLDRARQFIDELAKLRADPSVTFARHLDTWISSGRTGTDDLIQQFEAALDATFRFRHFHMAARFWEARWLAETPKEHEANDRRRTLNRAAMLAPVIVATAYMVPRIFGEFEFADLLIFDESGQAAPEIGAASFAFARKALVVGDTCQLKPVWNVGRDAHNRMVRDLGLPDVPDTHSAASGSIMRMAQTVTRYTGGGSNPLGHGIGLVSHYRCRADIIDYCRRLVYEDDLIPCRQEKPPFLYPAMAWVAVEVKRGTERQHGSRINRDQIEEIIRWLKFDESRILAHYGAKTLAEVVALIAPFRAQANALKNAMADAFGAALAESMVIGTVHKLQGSEKPIVAFTLTQDKADPRFFVDTDGPNLLNVAVSRAKDSFILFAAPNVLRGADRRKGARPQPLEVLVDYLNERGRRLYPSEYVIIEAPGKEHVVQAALGLSAKVVSTGGHFRDVETSGTELRFTVSNEVTVRRLREAAADLHHYDTVFLATDDDDDGEEIAWHVMKVFEQEGAADVRKFKRMRFHALTESDIRRARELALPGIDARRVRANLLRKLVDRRLHERLQSAGVRPSRPQLALLHEICRRTDAPLRWCVTVEGAVANEAVKGVVVEHPAGGSKPRWCKTEADAKQLAAGLVANKTLAPIGRMSDNVTLERYPPNTTVHMLISAYRRLGWLPRRTMEAMRSLYEGKRKGLAVGSQSAEDETP